MAILNYKKINILETSNSKLKDKNNKLTMAMGDLKFELKQVKLESRYKDKKIEELYKHSAKAEEIIAEYKMIIKDLKNENNTIKLIADEAINQNQKLKAQANRDHTNSSISSSKKNGYKKICNGRKPTENKPGGQTGHKGHRRKTHSKVDEVIKVPRSGVFLDENLYIETGEVIKKQVVDIVIGHKVTEYQFMKYKNKDTGEIVHVPIPQELHNEVSYGNDVKALATLLNSDANVSIDKTIEVISEISDKKINLSKGFVNTLNKKVVKESLKELDETFKNLQKFKYMHIDATNVHVNGKNVNVFVTANPHDTLYYAREKKGKKGVENTAAEDYCQLLVHDHDRTFYNYGSEHQECLAHILRYLQSAIENEPKFTWHSKMKPLLQKMISTVKNDSLDDSTKDEYITEYDSILELATKEYEE
ncbi:MAG: transposase, partial [Patescibacteria group bacterium]|nr:transposase [Patescibacteria group bacterium]